MSSALAIGAGVFGLELAIALLLTGLAKLGTSGQKISQFLCRAPGLDMLLVLMIVAPWITGGLLLGWAGIGVAVVGQILAMQVWVVGHEIAHRPAQHGPRITSFLNKRYGWWRNHLALWVTAVVLPVFFLIRAAETFVYPLLVWILNFKAYNQGEWVNVSRQKFEGLVGNDLIWCLYCDWMTGVYSLGAEMLRNVESFWCPIRFHYDKKCENCSLDFPDIKQGWVAADGTMQDVVQTLQEQMPPDGPWSWFADPDRNR